MKNENKLRKYIKQCLISELSKYDTDGRRLGRTGAEVAADQMIHDYKTKGMSKSKINVLIKKLSQRFSCKKSDIKSAYSSRMKKRGLTPQV